MPTPEKLDEVLDQKNKQIEQAIEKKKIYDQEIQSSIDELSAKRGELTNLKHQLEAGQSSLKDLENHKADQIHLLENKISDKNNVLFDLDAQIQKKKEQFEKEINVEKSQYEEKRKDLQSQTIILTQRIKELDEDIVDFKESQDKNTAWMNDLKEKQATLDDQTKFLDEQEAKFVRSSFEAQKKLQGELNQLAENQKRIKGKEQAVDSLRSDLTVKQKQAQETIARIDEAAGHEQVARAVADENRLERERLNAEWVKLKAEMKRLSLKNDELIALDRKLKEREDNIKLVEEKIAGEPHATTTH